VIVQPATFLKLGVQLVRLSFRGLESVLHRFKHSADHSFIDLKEQPSYGQSAFYPRPERPAPVCVDQG